MFHKLVDTYTEWCLKFNANKTEHLTTSLNVVDVLENIKLDNVEEFKHLESIIHQNGS